MSSEASTITEVANDRDALIDALSRSTRPRIAMVSHAWGGGVERHVQDLVQLVRSEYDVAVFRGFLNGGVDLTLYSANEAARAIRVGGFGATSLEAWIEATRALNFVRLHVHHLHGWPIEVMQWIDAIGCPVDITLHDFFYPCPQYHFADENNRYCGQPDLDGCRACVAKRPHAWGLSIEEWRSRMSAFLARAERVLAPTRDTAARTQAYFPDITPIVVPHPEFPISIPPIRKVAILGGLSAIKGLNVVNEVVTLARERNEAITFRLIGHASDALPAGITATGTYDDDDLPRLIAEERPDVIWFPAQVPETFSYTLSVARATGLSIVASDFESFRERLGGYLRSSWVSSTATAPEWLHALCDAQIDATKKTSDNAKLAEVSATRKSYVAMYALPLQHLPATCALAIAGALDDLLHNSPPAPSLPEHSVASLFRIGRYGGHRSSLDAVELHIAALPEHERQIVGRSVYDQVGAQIDHYRNAYQHADDAYRQVRENYEDEKTARLAALERHANEMRASEIAATNDARYIAHLQNELHRITSSRSWRYTRPLRLALRLGRIFPRAVKTIARLASSDRNLFARTINVFRREGVRGTLLRLRREIRKTVRPDEGLFAASTDELSPVIGALSLHTDERPQISIVIPVYEHHETTFACLKSIASHAPSTAFEIIVADDASPTSASDALSVVTGVRFVRQSQNLGFLRNMNAAVREARGEFVLILNNDTLLTAGAIDAMLQTFASHERVGLVGAKLLNADGSLQEAGGIVWQDGSAWNYGRGSHPLDPRFNYVRDADYCSGAALLVRKSLFDELNGFDEYYLPAYYEDTDLAFRVRDRGLRVLYQPHASIYHLEGVSHGKDVASGIKAHQATNEAKFFERWKGTLAKHRKNSDQPTREARREREKTVLIIEACMITPDQDSGSIRLLNLMRILRANGHHVIFLAENLEGTARYRCQLEALGIEVLYDAWAGSVKQTLRDRGAELDVVMLCRHYVASAHLADVRTYAAHARVVFDTVDLHFLREEREAALTNDIQMLERAQKTRIDELHMVASCDVTLVVSEVERDLLNQLQPSASVSVVSNVHEPVARRAGFAERDGILFVGGFRHPPNIDAVTWYAEEILPRVRALNPSILTKIVGSNMPPSVTGLARDGLEVVGAVPNLRPLLERARVSIAPLRYGAGVKGKINEAMNFGIPVVATSLAVEGMHLTHDVDCLVANDPGAFAAQIVELHGNAERWERISRAGAESLERHFSFDAVEAAFLGSLGLAKTAS